MSTPTTKSMGDDTQEAGGGAQHFIEARVESDSAGVGDSTESKGSGLYPPVAAGSDCAALTTQVAQLRHEKKQIEAALQAEISRRRQAEKAFQLSAIGVGMQLHAHTGQERVAPTPGPQRPNQVARGLEADTTAVLKKLNEEQRARLELEAEAKRLIANLKNEDFSDLSGLTGKGLCAELEGLHDFTQKLRMGMQDEHTRLEKAEGSLEELLNEVALMDKNRLSLEAELKELRARLRSQAEFKSQLDALREKTRREVDLVTRRSREEIDEECRQRMNAEGALDEMLKEITENELARRKAENASREAVRALEAEVAHRKKAEEELRNLEGVAREHHRCRSQAEGANSRLSAEVDALRKDCDHLRQLLKEEKQQRELADSAWKETARRLHGERAMHAYWVKKHKAFLEKGRHEIKEMTQQDADGGWMDVGLPDGRNPKHSQQLAYLDAPASGEGLGSGLALGGLAAHNLNLPSAAENAWDASQRNLITSSGVVGPGAIRLCDSKTSNLWCGPGGVDRKGLSSMSTVKASKFGVGETGLAHKYKDALGGALSEDFAFPKAPINGQPWEAHETSGRHGWLRHLNPLRPAKWVLNRRSDVAYHTGKILQNFWTWVVIVGVIAGSVGLDDGGDEDGERSPRGAAITSRHYYDPCTGTRSWGTGYDADSFMG